MGFPVISFSGREEDIYSLAGPHLVDGPHSQRIRQALNAGEQVRHFLLCPIWDSRSRPFGIQAPRASHALCLTDSRLLLTRIYPDKRRPPETWSIDRRALVGFDFGQAILMSWLVLYTRQAGTVVKDSFYFPRHGNQGVADLLGDWRASWPVEGREQAASPALSRHAICEGAGHFHNRLLEPLLQADEVCLRAYQRPPLWGSRWTWLGRRQVGLAYWGTLLLSDRSFFYVRGEPTPGKGGYVLSHNVSCFSTAQLVRVDCRHERIHGIDCQRLALAFAGSPETEVVVLVPESDAATARDWARQLAALRPAA
jgi:hypothetical protein